MDQGPRGNLTGATATLVPSSASPLIRCPMKLYHELYRPQRPHLKITTHFLNLRFLTHTHRTHTHTHTATSPKTAKVLCAADRRAPAPDGMEGVVFHQNTLEALSTAGRHASPPAGVEGVVFHQDTAEALSAADRRVSPPAGGSLSSRHSRGPICSRQA